MTKLISIVTKNDGAVSAFPVNPALSPFGKDGSVITTPTEIIPISLVKKVAFQLTPDTVESLKKDFPCFDP